MIIINDIMKDNKPGHIPYFIAIYLRKYEIVPNIQ
jgi:hypothetical protein